MSQDTPDQPQHDTPQPAVEEPSQAPVVTPTQAGVQAPVGHHYQPAHEAAAAYYAAQQQPGGQVPAAAPVAKKPRGAFSRGFGWGAGLALGSGLVWAIAGTLTFALPLAVIAAAAGSDQEPDSKVGEIPSSHVWGDKDAGSRERVLIFPVNGVIMGQGNNNGLLASHTTFGYNLAAKIDKVEKNDAAGIVLEMNTPGGSIFGSKAIASAVERYKERTGKKVTAYVRGISASGGMYAMAGADDVIADHGTLTGSIGVVMGPFERYKDVRESGSFMGSVRAEGGITREYFSAGKGKDFGNPYRDMAPEERAHYQAGIEKEYVKFVKHVADNRKISESKIRDDLGAYVFGPEEAVEAGLVDHVAGQQEAYSRIAKTVGVREKEVEFRIAKDADGFLSLLGVKIDPRKVPGLATAEPVKTWQKANAANPAMAPVCAVKGTVWAFHGNVHMLCTTAK